MIKRTRILYTAEQKKESVRESKRFGAKRYCRNSGLPISTLNKWLKEERLGIEMKDSITGYLQRRKLNK